MGRDKRIQLGRCQNSKSNIPSPVGWTYSAFGSYLPDFEVAGFPGIIFGIAASSEVAFGKV